MKALCNAMIYVMLVGHAWAIWVAFEANGFGLWGWISAIGTLCLPFIAEAAWGIWAFMHGHPYLWGSIGFFAAMGLGGILNRAVSKE